MNLCAHVKNTHAKILPDTQEEELILKMIIKIHN
jgi:hypothetical protein